MLILSDFDSQGISLEDQQPLKPHRQLSPSVFLGPVASYTQFVHQQRIKVIVCATSVLSAVKLYRQEIRDGSILMLVLDQNFNVSRYNDEELSAITDFQMSQSKLLQEMNDKFNVNTKLSVPFVTSDLLSSLTNLNNFLYCFKLHYPNLSVLINHGGPADDSELSTVVAWSYLIRTRPQDNWMSILQVLRALEPSDTAPLQHAHYEETMKKFWESNYLVNQMDSKDKRSLVVSNNDTTNDENSLKRKRV